MSLKTDIIFVKALQSNATLMNDLAAHDVYNTAIGMPDEDVDNAPLPYIIVRFDGMQNDDETKDNDFEGGSDKVQIGITVCCENRADLGDMMETVRDTIRDYFMEHRGDDSEEDFALIPDSMTPSAGSVNYDALKPCFWQELNYQCDTNP